MFRGGALPGKLPCVGNNFLRHCLNSQKVSHRLRHGRRIFRRDKSAKNIQRQNLWNPAHARGHSPQAATHRFVDHIRHALVVARHDEQIRRLHELRDSRRRFPPRQHHAVAHASLMGAPEEFSLQRAFAEHGEQELLLRLAACEFGEGVHQQQRILDG